MSNKNVVGNTPLLDKGELRRIQKRNQYARLKLQLNGESQSESQRNKRPQSAPSSSKANKRHKPMPSTSSTPTVNNKNNNENTDKGEIRRIQKRGQYVRRKLQFNCESQPASKGEKSLKSVPSSNSTPIEDPPLKLSAPHKLRRIHPCRHCLALRIPNEPLGFCCAQGKIKLANSEVSDELYELFTSPDLDCENFRAHVRQYNSIFGFTSFRGRVDQELANSKHGIYTFKAQGQVYHDFPSLIPKETGPSFFQLYFYDTQNEVQNRMEIMNPGVLNSETVDKLVSVMANNPYAKILRTLDGMDLDNHVLNICSDVNLDQRVYNAPTSDQVAAVWIEGNNPSIPNERDIKIYARDGDMYNVKHYYGCYDPLQYPLLFPYGEVGWHQNILKVNVKNSGVVENSAEVPAFPSAADMLANEQLELDGGSITKVSCREYYSYKFQIRDGDRSVLLYSRRLLQQYMVDMYIKVETTRLDFFRKKQSKIRAELYQGIADSVLEGEFKAENVGKRVVLPASFIGGPRDMRRRYLDAIALVSKYGKPDLFITMTCNPEWPEITDLLKEGQTAQDRPDLTTRIFRAKIHDLKKELFKNNIFGEVAAHVHVIEFQKRGLPHCHMLIILKKQYKIITPEQFDEFICAEIPDPKRYPDLHKKVIKHMMHGPCGELNPTNVCMRPDGCKNHYPKPFCSESMQGKDSYPLYRRRDNGLSVLVRNAVLDNRWVVPYNPYLLSRFDCHINVEVCSGVKCVKYLYKYIYKGHDKTAAFVHHIDNQIEIDEIKQFQDARWVAAQEAMWRIYGFNLNEMYPAVINLQLHLPNQQYVSYWENQNLKDVLAWDLSSKTMLTEFFNYCLLDKSREPHLYVKFPEKFTWDRTEKTWTRRANKNVIGRINAANPKEGERYYLRLLLLNVRRPTSFEDLLLVHGVRCATFKEAASKRGLLESDDWLFECFVDACSFQMPSALRRLFATVLVFCGPTDVRGLWDKFYEDLSDDFNEKKGYTLAARLQKTLESLDYFLDSMGRSVTQYNLPRIDFEATVTGNDKKREVNDELSIETPNADTLAVKNLNPEQRSAYDCILEHVIKEQPQVFFIDGPGGTGKTFLYRALLATIRGMNKIALATATSGVAASIMPGGRTCHSRFKIPIDGDEAGMCNISKQSGTAELIRQASLIIWDEAPMAKRSDIESVDRTFRDILCNDMIFGGKVIVLGGDFRQVLPVVPRGSRAQTVDASLARSYLWSYMHKLHLTKNMRAQNDTKFSELLLRIGNGTEPTSEDGLIELPKEMIVHCDNQMNPEASIIKAIFKDIKKRGESTKYITERAILATRNECVDMLNEKLISSFPGEEYTYASFDEAIDDTNHYYPEEFLNTLTPNGFPPHMLVLKLNCPIMLMRNLSPSEGLCNGTRMVCKGFRKNVIYAEITMGQYSGKEVLLHRIPMHPPKNDSFPFQFRRMQFPIRLCFAMTINKAQGQTIPTVGVYLPQPVFSHGQLYVALSRGTSMATTKVLVDDKNKEKKTKKTRNIVYKEVLTS